MVAGEGGEQKAGQDPRAPQIGKDQEDRSRKGTTLGPVSWL